MKGQVHADSAYKDSCSVRFTFNGLSYGFLDFTMTVSNKSTDSIIIGPKSCSYVPYYDPLDTNRNYYPHLIQCIDPGQRTKFLAEEQTRLLNEKNPYSSLGYVAISIVVQALSKDKNAAEQAANERQKNADEWEISHLQAINNIRDQIDFWKEVAMGSVVVIPGKVASGRIFFPVEERATAINIKVNIRGNIKETFYKQEIITRN